MNRKGHNPHDHLSGDSPLNRAVAQRDASIVDMVKEALLHGQTRLALQPVTSLDPDGKVAFYEGLIRVLDETERVFPAREFMPIVEDQELGRELDRTALNLGCRLLHEHPTLRLSINLSARSIGYQPWMQTLNRCLKKDPTIGPRLILEIREKSAMQIPELLIDLMHRLQPAGVCFALDNFGSSETALRHFRDFLFDMVKIDGQFIRGISSNPDNQVLVAAMCGIADQFDMMTVAEKVEAGEDAAFLSDMGIDFGQGFYFGSPTMRMEKLLGPSGSRLTA